MLAINHVHSTTFTYYPCTNSNILFRGKGDDFRLGHGSEEHCRFPKVIEALRGKDVIDISLGPVHCLALTRDGKVYAWGGNDKGQLGISNCESKNIPTEVDVTTATSFQCVACGPAQVFTRSFTWHIHTWAHHAIFTSSLTSASSI